jgi:hypothetical protein
MDQINKILSDRPSIHGEFAENSRATWEMLRAMQHERNWPTLSDQQRHALYMIAHKMARISCGDPNEPDHWDDIAGYAKCVANRLRDPVIAYDGTDVYAALAVAWNMPREDAKARVQEIMHARATQARGEAQEAARPKVAAPAKKLPTGRPWRPSANVPGTPEDGGQHASAEDALEQAAEELRKEIEDEYRTK